jgi:hypothetical protein
MGTYRFDGQSCQRWQKSKARKGRAPTTLKTSKDRSMSTRVYAAKSPGNFITLSAIVDAPLPCVAQDPAMLFQQLYTTLGNSSAAPS